MRRVLSSCVLAGLAAGSSPALAWHFETRIVERIGNTDVPLANGELFLAGTSHRLRFQFGVFDDAGGAAPAGGYLGWNTGTLSTTAGTWTRTPGRLVPFNFAPQSNANGSPVNDPFNALTQIDNTLGFQTLPWFCDGTGNPEPRPEAVIRGLNTFISTYEVTVQTPGGASTIDLTWGGQTYASNAWRYQPDFSIEPDCVAGTDGNAYYTPTPLGPVPFSQSLRIQVVVPAPGAAGIVVALGYGALRRRRR